MAMTQTKWKTSWNQMEARQNKDSNKSFKMMKVCNILK